MSSISLASAVPRLVHRRFSTGSLQHIKQTESEASVTGLKWERTLKGVIAVVGISGLSFSAINTRNMYDSRERYKTNWNMK